MSESIADIGQKNLTDHIHEISQFESLRQKMLRCIGRGVLVLSMAIPGGGILATAEGVLQADAAMAVTDDYPDKDAVPCAGWSSWCKNGRDYSTRGYGYRNCTDWAAWRIPQITGQTVPWGLSNADLWDNNAPAWAEVDRTPEVGDAAIWDSMHVAVVESVNVDGSVNISEYNVGVKGLFGTRRNMRADHYIDFTPSVNEGNRSSSSTGGGRADFNGDGRGDVLLYSPGAPSDHVFYGRVNAGDFGRYGIKLDHDYQIAVANFNNDGEADFFAYGQNGSPDYIFYGQPNAAEFNQYGITINDGYQQIVGGDYDGDDFGDVFLYRPGTGEEKIMSGASGGGNFTYQTSNVQLENDYLLSSGDYNNDNLSDVFLYNPTGTDYVLYGTTNKGQFNKQAINQQIDRTYNRPVSGDFDSDGRDDVLLYGEGQDADRIFYGGQLLGNFAVERTSIDGIYRVLSTGDYNGDSYDDVVLHAPGGANDKVLYGQKTRGGFSIKTIQLDGNYRSIST